MTARTSAFAFKGQGIDVREIGKTLDVGTVLEGSVRRDGDRIRVTAQLIDASSGYHLWSESFDRLARDVFAVQEEIARGVTAALDLPSPTARPAGVTTASVAAYEAYLRGRYLLRNKTRPRILTAIEHFQRAIALDSGYARAWAGLADAYTMMAEYMPPSDILPTAKAAAERGLRLDSALVESRIAMADLLLVHDRSWADAEAHYRAAIFLDPGSALALERFARFLAAARRFDEHLEVTRQALALRAREPREEVERAVREHTALAAAYFAAQRFDTALVHGLAALKLDPSSWAVNAVIGRTYVELGRHAEAIAALEIAWPASQALPALTRLGYAYGRAGRTADAQRVLARLRAIADSAYLPKDQIALVQLGLGDRDGAIASLWQAYEERHWWLPWINQSPPFDTLRSDARYVQLLEELGAP